MVTVEDRHAHLDQRCSDSLDAVAFGLHHEVVTNVSVGKVVTSIVSFSAAIRSRDAVH